LGASHSERKIFPEQLNTEAGSAPFWPLGPDGIRDRQEDEPLGVDRSGPLTQSKWATGLLSLPRF